MSDEHSGDDLKAEETGDLQPPGDVEPPPAAEAIPPAGPPPPGSVPLPEPPKPLRVVPPAHIDDVSPDHGPVIGDTKITLSGEHLYRESLVRIGGAIARTVGANEPHRLQVLTPPSDQIGIVDVSVQNPNAEVFVLHRAFRYLALPPPKIVSVAPNHLPLDGGEITIVGEGFLPQTQVLLNGAPAEHVRFVDGTTLDVKVPANADGSTIDVAVENPDGKKDVEKRAVMHDERYG